MWARVIQVFLGLAQWTMQFFTAKKAGKNEEKLKQASKNLEASRREAKLWRNRPTADTVDKRLLAAADKADDRDGVS